MEVISYSLVKNPIARWVFLIALLSSSYSMAADTPPELIRAGCVTDIKKVAASKTEDVYYCFNKNDVGIVMVLNTTTRQVKATPDLKNVPDWKQNIFLRSR